jgi:hypothetical protein
MAGGGGYRRDEGRNGGPYTNVTATIQIFANTDRPPYRPPRKGIG